MAWRTLPLAACLTLVLSACQHDDAPEPSPSPSVVDQDTSLAYEGYAAGWTDCWQSFTAGRSGALTAVRVWAMLPSNVTLTAYEGEGVSGSTMATTTLLMDLGTDRWVAELPDLPVTAGETYTVRLTAASNLNWVIGTYTYAGGVSNVYGAAADFGVTTFVR